MESQNQSNEFSNLAKITIEAQSDYFPDAIYDNLPTFLRESCEVFNDKREKDVFLSGSLVVLGGCFHNVYAYNSVDKKAISPNLFAFIVAPPASGKRALQYSKKLADKVKQAFNLHSIMTETGKTRRLFIPANISLAGIIHLLDNNEGIGIMVESEIDTLVNAYKQEWGNYSDVVRNAFENESYSMYRKTSGEFTEIERVQLSLALSGTISQFKNLIGSVENGLFSRGCYYIYENQETILKPFGRMNSDVDIDDRFEDFATIVMGYYKSAISLGKIKVIFNEEQMGNVQAALQVIYNIVTGKNEKGFEANVKRAFSIVLKIATILTFLEKCENNSLSNEIPCTHKSLVSSMSLTLIYLIHGSKAYDILSVNNAITLNRSEQRLYFMLQEQFTQDEALIIANEIGLKERTSYNAINGLKEKGWIVLQPDGTYKKQL